MNTDTSLDNVDKLLTQRQVAGLLNVSPRCLENWRHRGGGPPFIAISPRCIRYTEDDLVAWVAARRRQSTSEKSTHQKP